MAQILFVTPYCPPEKGAAQVRISENAKRLVKRGHQVTVLTTFPNYPTGIVPPEYQHKFFERELIDGVSVVRVWSYVAPHKGFVRRMLAQLSFGCLAPLLGGKAVGRQDLIIVQSPPLFDAIAGRVLAWVKHCPFIFMVSDLWPESAVQLDAVPNSLFVQVAEWLEWSTYQKASLVWALSRGIRDRLLQRGLARDHVFVLTNGADTTRFRPLPQKDARTELGWRDIFTVLYAGTHGVSHGLSTVLDAAELLQEQKEVHFIFVGDGSEKAELVAEAKRRELANVTFFNALPHEKLPLALAAADMCVVPMRKVPLFAGRLPLKMFEIMAAGRPFLLGVDGEARELAVTKANAALYIEPENAEALAEGILFLQKNPEEAEALGRSGRAYIETHFEREQLANELDERITTLLGKIDGLKQKRKRLPQRALEVILIGGDSIVFIASLVLTLMVFPYLNPLSASIEPLKIQITWMCLSFLFWCIATNIAHTQKLTNAVSRIQSVSCIVYTLVLTSLFWMAHADPFTGNQNSTYISLLPDFLGLTGSILCIWRVLFAEMIILPRLRSRAVVIGANVAGRMLTKELQQARRVRTTLLGYIHEGSDLQQGEDSLPILGGSDVLQSLIKNRAIDRIITAISFDQYPDLFRKALDATQQGITITPMTIAYESICGKLPVEHIGDQWYASLPTENTTSSSYICWHKAMDIVFGMLGVTVLLCVLPILAPLIYFSSPGPIFYHQERLGYRGKKFYIHKFRSMHVHAEQVGHAVWAKEKDTRVTPIGRFMRATHLDELPQMLNVLRGEMSLIGPRPERQEFVAELEKTIPYYRYRLLVKPGLTGWAQVKHSYTNTEQEALVKSQYDLYYIRHQSLMLDISILLRTVIEVLFCRGV